MRWRARSGRVTAAVVVFASLIAVPAARADRSLEYAVKATFLGKFASFVEWPPGTFENETSPFHLCVVGADPYAGRIAQAVAGETVGKHPIVLRELDAAQRGSGCQVMFLSGTATQSVREALQAVAGTPTLTVTDSALGPAAGIIHFVIAEGRVTFDIDNVGAAQNRLVISSKLLTLARKLHVARRGPRP
jgi:hypothetical protein